MVAVSGSRIFPYIPMISVWEYGGLGTGSHKNMHMQVFGWGGNLAIAAV